MRLAAFQILIGLLSLACATESPPRGDSCVSFSVLDTKVDGNVVYDLGPVPVLEVLPIRQSDIVSAEYRRERIPESIPKKYYGAGQSHFEQVEVELSPSAAAVLTQASTKYRLKKLGISRDSFQSIEPGMMGAPTNDRIVISVPTEQLGRELVAMLTAPCG